MPVIVYLTNGVRLKGTIKGFDSFVILLKDASQQLVYKHAVSTIVPERDLDIRFEDQH
jgi:host factor-I protein